jgi:hypothetical protein
MLFINIFGCIGCIHYFVHFVNLYFIIFMYIRKDNTT